MQLYRIAYVSASQAHSVVRQLPVQPVPGDHITLDANTVVTVREVVAHSGSDHTIAAEVIADADAATEKHR